MQDCARRAEAKLQLRLTDRLTVFCEGNESQDVQVNGIKFAHHVPPLPVLRLVQRFGKKDPTSQQNEHKTWGNFVGGAFLQDTL